MAGMYPITLDEIKSTIAAREGIARSNRFAVNISMPLLDISLTNILTNVLQGNKLTNGMINNPKDLSILCESVTMPGVDIQTFDTAFGNKRTKLAQGYDQGDVQLTFLLTNDYFVKNFFDKWSNKVVNKQTGLVGYKSSYQSDVIVTQLDQNNFPLGGVKLYNAFPTVVQDIQLSNTADNDITRLSVTLAYDRALPQDSIQSGISTFGSILGSVGFNIGF